VGQIDDLTAGVGVSYDPLTHSRHNGEVQAVYLLT